ncbi:MAG: hypothetical protein M3Y07_16405 [Acidobacteriota bacterium]|nr:hypothetical protein [Acidobacteriota bacterium]
MRAFLPLSIGLMAIALFAAPKRDWREGKIVKIDAETIVEGTHAQRFYYTIDIGPSLLIVTEKAAWRWSKPSQIEEGDTVKWSLDKRRVYMISPDGIEHTLALRHREEKPERRKPNL